jgi:hypothetical protein
MGEMSNTYEFWSENLKERDHFRDLGLHGRIILTWMLEKQECEDVERIQLAPGRAQCQALENGNEGSGFIRGEFID